MGQQTPHSPVLLILAAFSRRPQALDWAKRQAVTAWGPVALESPPFEFTDTDYYTPTMGPGLKKIFWAFERLVDPAVLADVKRTTDGWEREFARERPQAEPRPLNLDPGYLTPAKLVLASTKDHAHRIYLRDGIYAEVTLYFKSGAWQIRDWTFPDYRRPEYHAFFQECRGYLRRRAGSGA